MKRVKSSALWWIAVTIGLVMISLAGSSPARAQGEKRTVFTERDFHWQGHLKAGQTLEVINRNGGIDASTASGDAASASGTWRHGDDSALGGSPCSSPGLQEQTPWELKRARIRTQDKTNGCVCSSI